jgi:hypothetical protein
VHPPRGRDDSSSNKDEDAALSDKESKEDDSPCEFMLYMDDDSNQLNVHIYLTV